MTAAAATTDTFVCCQLCSEVDAQGRCTESHAICGSCASVGWQMTEKMMGTLDLGVMCPLVMCTGMLGGEAPAPGRRRARLVALEPEGAEYQRIAADLGTEHAEDGAHAVTTRGVKRTITIVNIHRVENPALFAIYDACRDLMLRRLGGAAKLNERQVYHSTTRQAAGGIVREGFNIHRIGQAHGAALGLGIYVAINAGRALTYGSPGVDGNCTLIVCSALLGDSGAAGVRVAGGHVLGRVGADQQTDSTSGGWQYAVHREQQVLPTFIVTYRP